MTTVLKLGGSVLTVKDEPETVDEANLERAAAAVAAAVDGAGESPAAGLVVVHGGGSFGHPHAARHGVSTTEGTADAGAVRGVHGAMRRLNDVVVDALADAGVPAVPVHPLSGASRDGTGSLSVPADVVSTALGEGFVPVLHGDVVVHAGEGATVLSGDELVVALAESLSADRVGVCSAEPGVYDADGEVVERIDDFGSVADALGGSDATDVTGGMAGKVRQLLTVDAEASIFDLEGLEAFIAGESPGTRIG